MGKLLGIMTALMLLMTFGKFVWRRIPVLKAHKRSLNFMIRSHKYWAWMTVLLGLYHGIRAFGWNFLFTGHLLLSVLAINLTLGHVLDRRVTRTGIQVHRMISFAAVGLLLLHNLAKYLV